MKIYHLLLGVLLWCIPWSATTAGDLPPSTPSGILVNRTLPLAHLDRLDGTGLSEPVSLARWRQSVFELQVSAEHDLGWDRLGDVPVLARQSFDRNTIPLGLLHARYDELDESREMQTREVFAFTSLREKTYTGEAVNFILDASSVLRHKVEKFSGIQFDAGDGWGYRSLAPGVEIQVSYRTTGIKKIALVAVLPGGSQLESTSHLEVVRVSTPEPTQTRPITASQSWEGVAGTGKAYIYLAEGDTQLTNPIVVVEGFDIDNSIDWPVLYDLLNRENLLEDLRAAGFDMVLLDFTEAVDAIQRNAFVLTELLQWVNTQTAPGQSIALVGVSSGGNIARYGLLWMEQQAIAHQVRNFISLDAPHKGANVPLGLQKWVEFFADQSESAEFFISRLRAPGSKQLLYYHVDETAGTTANPDGSKAALTGEMQALGDWPAKSRLVSIINGSGFASDQGFSAGDQIILYEYSSFIAEIIGNTWAVPDGGNQLIFNGLIESLLGDSDDTLTIEGTIPWDNAPGGSRSSMDDLADTTAPYGDIVALHGSHSFVPTISGLALDSEDPFYDVAGDAALMTHTPFDQVYFPSTNQQHIDINAENKVWLMSEIQAGIDVSINSGDTTEDLGTASFSITARHPPTAPVSIALLSSNTVEGIVMAEVVLPSGSVEPQIVTVTGQDDDILDGDVQYTITTAAAVSIDKAYQGIDPPDVELVNRDNETDTIFEHGFES